MVALNSAIRVTTKTTDSRDAECDDALTENDKVELRVAVTRRLRGDYMVITW